MKTSPFLPPRSTRAAMGSWTTAVLAAAAVSLAAAGAIAALPRLEPDPMDEQGAELVLEFAPMITSMETRAQQAAEESAQPDQQAKPKVEEVLSKAAAEELPTEQTSPEAPEDPDLRMAKEQTQQKTEAEPDTRDTTEASEAKEQHQAQQAAVAAVAAPDHRAEQEPDKSAAAPDHGNAAEAQKRLLDWQKAIFAHVGRFKRYPEEARKRHATGEVVVYFRLDRSGGVSDMRVERGSGSASLDLAALDVLKRASPLPIPPAEMRGEAIELLLPMRYQLR